ncbi:hypothetical protein [Nafulsella turpanensis]|uniref:hypothetical protein n=1 Tax=Nafulsella turpanensis TaxID=1265690 RepID=UPI00034A008F|nr:hypothetical protein [Nafulsella turpanensis]
MSEEFILRYAEQRVKERGYDKFLMRYHDLLIQGEVTKEINAFNEIYFLISADEGISIQSDYGEYDYGNSSLSENVHEHADQIRITNYTSSTRRAQFIQVIFQQ